MAGVAIIIAGLAFAIFAPNLSLRDTAERDGGVAGVANPSAGFVVPDRPSPVDDGTSSGAIGMEDGLLTGPASPFDLDLPAIGHLDADLLRAVQQAARDASADGVPFVVTSGWRSPAYQQQLLDEAVADYGSVEEARRVVATPETSAHVMGQAVDIGPTDADSWLSQHGSDYGLCQTYANEIWHFELATVPGGECPTMLPDASS